MRYFNVPLITQEQSMSCWHASARMVWAYKNYQCVHPLPNLYQSNSGASPADFIRLAKELGLETVQIINQSYSWQKLAELLRRHGPLWVAGYWYGVPHIMVLTGAEPNGTIYFNDPAGAYRTHDINFFNQKIASGVNNPIMYLPDSRANAHGLGSFTR